MTAFTARTIRGSGRGKDMGVPTVNVDLRDVPQDVEEGIYAAWVQIGDARHAAAMHYGPRPVHGDAPSCEVHLLDARVDDVPSRITIDPVRRLRAVQDFPDETALIAAIEKDIADTRAILGV